MAHHNNIFMRSIISSMLLTVSIQCQSNQSSIPVITQQEELDLELFQTTNPETKPFFDRIDCTHTVLGKKFLQNIIRQPLNNKEELENRQELIKALGEPTRMQAVNQALLAFKAHESALYDLWQPQDAVQEAALEEFYFKLTSLTSYNANPALLNVLQLCTTANLFAPLIEHLLLHFFISNAVKEKYHIGCNHDHHHDHDHAHASPASLLVYNLYNVAHFSFHLMGAKAIYDHITQKATVIKNMQHNLISASRCIESLHSLYTTGKNNPSIASLPHYQAVAELFEQSDLLPECDTSAQLIAILGTSTFKTTASVWSNIGNVLAAYQLMEHAHALKSALEYVGAIDAHASIARLYTRHENEYHAYTFAKYNNQTTPHASLVNVWNPHLGNACCTHSMDMGSGNPTTSIIVGDNAAGKSTMIKSMALAILLGQTLTIVPADQATFTPFAKITTSIKHSDNVQAGTSLFIAETLKAQALLDTLEYELKAGQFSFAVFDELFKSTSFEKGERTAMELISTLGKKYPNNLTLVATHYANLTELASQDPLVFKSYLSQKRRTLQGNTVFELTAKP